LTSLGRAHDISQGYWTPPIYGIASMDSAVYSFAGMDAPVDEVGLFARQNGQSTDGGAALEQLGQFTNFSSRDYDAYVFTFDYKTTGCNQRGVLPVPLAKNNTCLPGWYCT